MQDGAPPTSFLSLDGVRGIGALLVVAGHSFLFWGVSVPPALWSVCVDAFFMLSGFVIAFAYEPRFASGMGAGQFILARLIRLWPLYLLGILLGLLIEIAAMLGGGGKSLDSTLFKLVPQLFMLPAPDDAVQAAIYPFNMPAGTLFFELAINVVYVLVWRFLSLRVLVGIVVLSAAALVVSILAYGGIGDAGWRWPTFWGGFARASFGFFCGVLVYRLAGSPRRNSGRASYWALAGMVAVPAVLALRPPQDLFALAEWAATCLFCPAILWMLVKTEPPRWFQAIAASLGSASYAIYIVHFPVYDTVLRASWRIPQLAEWAPLTGAAILVAVVILAFVAERWYDRPVRRWLTGFVRRLARRPATQEAPAALSLRRVLVRQRRSFK
jgi:peptidoglycan/LPS O-acetylase OafA/YrhL